MVLAFAISESVKIAQLKQDALRKKCLYSELCWYVFLWIRTKCRELNFAPFYYYYFQGITRIVSECPVINNK